MELYIQHPTLPFFISNEGNVKNLDFSYKHKRVDYLGYVIISSTKQTDKGSKFVIYKVHRLVAELHIPAPSKELIEECKNAHHGKPCVKHLDNDKTNNKASNLRYDTSAGNTRDAWEEGLIVGLKGEANGRSILTEDIVHKLCAAFEKGMMPKEATEVFGVSMQQATKIRAGFQWKHIWCQYNIKVNRRKTRTSNDQSQDVD